MALRGTLTHRKTRRLAQALNIPPCFALGLLEALWNVTAEQAPDGAIGLMKDEDIAMEMFYDGDAAKMIEALVAAELLDRDGRARLIVHDWHLHSDDTTDAKLARARRRYANGAIPRMRKLSQKERDSILAEYESQADPAGAQPNLAAPSAHNGALPEPEPEPEPEPKANTPQPPAQAQGACGVESSDNGERSGTVVPIDEARCKREAQDDAGMRRRGAPPGVESAIWVAAVDSVLLACDSRDRKLRKAVEGAMHVATAKARDRGDSHWPDEIASRMVESWMFFTGNLDRMRYHLGALNFFGQGIWADQARWPWDANQLRSANQASIGMR